MKWLGGLVFLVGCKAELTDCVATVDPDIGTVIHLEWTTSEAGTSAVQFGVDGELNRVTEPIEGADTSDGTFTHKLDLLGLPSLTDVTWVATTTDADGNERTCEGETRTNNLSPSVPDTLLDTNETALLADSWDYLAFTTFGAFKSTLAVVDRDANVVWWTYGPESHDYIDIEEASDGTIRADSFHRQHTIDESAVHTYSLSNGYLVSDLLIPDGHHMFTTLPDGTLAYDAIDIRPWFDEEEGAEVAVVGDKLVEIAPDGSSRDVFNLWDWATVEKRDGWDAGFYPQGKDWSHMNAVKYYPETDTYLLSFAHLDAIVEVDRATGAPIRWFGERVTTTGLQYPFSDGSVLDNPHDPSLLANGDLLVFSGDPAAQAAGALQIAIDDDTHHIEVVDRIGYEQLMVNPFLGQAFRGDDGGTTLSYASRGTVREFTPDGELVWEMKLGQGNFFGSIEPFHSFPSESP